MQELLTFQIVMVNPIDFAGETCIMQSVFIARQSENI